MNTGIAAFSGFCVAMAGWLWLHDQAPKATTLLALLAGLGFGGFLGSLLGELIGAGVRAFGTATAGWIGVGGATIMAGLALIGTLEVLVRGIWPRTAYPRRWHPPLALLLPTIVIAGSVPLLSVAMGAISSGMSSLGAVLAGGGSAGMFVLGPVTARDVERGAITCTPSGGTRGQSVAGFADSQLAHAAAIIAVGDELGVPERAKVIAVAVAMQESGLRMYANTTVPVSLQVPHERVGSDHDSVGLFQQRPGWGTVTERMDSRRSARLFYERLLTVPGWQALPLTVAAQRVQISRFPQAYAKWEDEAAQVVAAVGGIVCEPVAV